MYLDVVQVGARRRDDLLRVARDDADGLVGGRLPLGEQRFVLRRDEPGGYQGDLEDLFVHHVAAVEGLLVGRESCDFRLLHFFAVEAQNAGLADEGEHQRVVLLLR